MTAQPPPDPRLRVLLVDDDIELREQLVAAFDATRFAVAVAEGVPAAIHLGERHGFDVLVCGQTTTLAMLHDHATRWGTNAIAFTKDSVVTGGRGVSRVLPRPATLAALREALLEVTSRT